MKPIKRFSSKRVIYLSNLRQCDGVSYQAWLKQVKIKNEHYEYGVFDFSLTKQYDFKDAYFNNQSVIEALNDAWYFRVGAQSWGDCLDALQGRTITAN